MGALDALEGNVVVEILAAPGTAPGLLGLGRGACAPAAPARAPTPARARTPPRRRPGARRAHRPTPPAPAHLPGVTDYLGRVAAVPLLVLPLACAEAPLGVDLRALAH